jgi:TRAP-type transport system small permease protein
MEALMTFNSALARVESIIHWLSAKINLVALIGVVVLMILVFADVMLRYFFNSPITGSYDVAPLILLVIVAAGLAQNQVIKANIAIDFLVTKLNRRSRSVVACIGYLLSIGLFVLISWRSFIYATVLLQKSEVTHTIRLPLGPFAYVIAVCSALFCLVLLIDLVKSIQGVYSNER